MNRTKYFYSSTVFKYSFPRAHILLEYLDFLLEFFLFSPNTLSYTFEANIVSIMLYQKQCILNTLVIGSQIKRKKKNSNHDNQ